MNNNSSFYGRRHLIIIIIIVFLYVFVQASVTHCVPSCIEIEKKNAMRWEFDIYHINVKTFRLTYESHNGGDSRNEYKIQFFIPLHANRHGCLSK